jgi:hypothetical protein
VVGGLDCAGEASTYLRSNGEISGNNLEMCRLKLAPGFLGNGEMNGNDLRSALRSTGVGEMIYVLTSIVRV